MELLTAQRATDSRPQPDKNVDTFGLFQKQDGQLGMGNKVVQVQLDENGKTLIVDDKSRSSHLVY